MIEQIGSWWLPQQEQHLRQYLKNNSEYQWQNRQWALKDLPRGGQAIDVGAHVGLWLRDLTEHFDHVLAVEPRDLHRQCLELNVPGKNYTLYACLLGDHEGQAGLEIDPENSGHTHRKPEGTIPVKTLDSLVPDDRLQKLIRLIKIDVEGDELRVIRGAERVIKTARPRMCIEQKDHPLAELEGRYAARDLLLSWGYVPLQHKGDDWVLEWRG